MHTLKYSDNEVIKQNLLEHSVDWLWLDESKEEVLIKKKVFHFFYDKNGFFLFELFSLESNCIYFLCFFSKFLTFLLRNYYYQDARDDDDSNYDDGEITLKKENSLLNSNLNSNLTSVPKTFFSPSALQQQQIGDFINLTQKKRQENFFKSKLKMKNILYDMIFLFVYFVYFLFYFTLFIYLSIYLFIYFFIHSLIFFIHSLIFFIYFIYICSLQSDSAHISCLCPSYIKTFITSNRGGFIMGKYLYFY